jgi:ligand-binding sensor domain-containing protein
VFGRVLGLPGQEIMAIAPNVGNKTWVGTGEGLAWVSSSTGRALPHGIYVNPAAR